LRIWSSVGRGMQNRIMMFQVLLESVFQIQLIVVGEWICTALSFVINTTLLDFLSFEQSCYVSNRSSPDRRHRHKLTE